MLVVAILVLGGGGLYLWWRARTNYTEMDKETLCSVNAPPREIVSLILDVSDEFSESQQLAVINALTALQQTVPQFGRVDVYSVGRSPSQVIKPVLSICNPGDGATANELYENPQQVRKRWLEFSGRLRNEIVTLTASSGAPISPIMEAVQAAALRTFNDVNVAKVPRRLVVVSDLLQHVPGKFSQYDSVATFAEFKSSPYFSQVRADLSNVGVILLYLVRNGAPQKWPNHRVFWEEYFAAQGAHVDRLEPIFGDR
jgi:hypothetical protein